MRVTQETRGGMKTWTFLDRTDWSAGEWDNEPIDKAAWKDNETGLDCMIHRNSMGTWCGYVGVPEDHPFFGDDYDQHYDLNVHGGLTFADACHGMEESGKGICHPNDEGDHVWWFGFDCAHYMDKIPNRRMSAMDGTYRNQEYVTAEVTSLAKQLAETSQWLRKKFE